MWPCVNRRGRNIRNHLVAQYRNVTTITTERPCWQLHLTYDRVRLSIITTNHINGVTQVPDVLIKVIGNHLSGRRCNTLEQGCEMIAILDRYLVV